MIFAGFAVSVAGAYVALLAVARMPLGALASFGWCVVGGIVARIVWLAAGLP